MHWLTWLSDKSNSRKREAGRLIRPKGLVCGMSFMTSLDVEGMFQSRQWVGGSAGTVANHPSTMAAVVEVGAELKHARVAVGFAAAAAAAEWGGGRHGDAAALG
jgi:hypothetical protein